MLRFYVAFLTRSLSHSTPTLAAVDSVIVLRLGDAAFTTLAATGAFAGYEPAYPTYWDEYDIAGTLMHSAPNAQISSGSVVPCTLGVGNGEWLYDTDGLPSLSVDGKIAIAPCFTIPVGADIASALDARKVISILGGNGVATQSTPFAAYTESFANGGVRQAVTIDGTAFWIAGMGSFQWGFRYLASPASNVTTLICSSSESQPGYYDARGVTIFDGQLYASDSSLDAGWAGLFTLGSGLPTTATLGDEVLLPGFDGDEPSVWTFVFENASSIWVAVDAEPGYEGNIEHFVFTGGTWVPQGPVHLDVDVPVYSIAGRLETSSLTSWEPHYIVYGTAASSLYRYDSVTHATTVVTTSVAGQFFRGVVLPPLCPPTASPTPTSLPTATATSSATASGTPRYCDSEFSYCCASVHVARRVASSPTHSTHNAIVIRPPTSQML